jgi:hypothetical protein
MLSDVGVVAMGIDPTGARMQTGTAGAIRTPSTVLPQQRRSHLWTTRSINDQEKARVDRTPANSGLDVLSILREYKSRRRKRCTEWSIRWRRYALIRPFRWTFGAAPVNRIA